MTLIRELTSCWIIEDGSANGKREGTMDPKNSARKSSVSVSSEERQASRKSVQSSMVVPAIVINRPDLSLYTTLQNLLNYCLECANSFVKETSDRKGLGEQFSKCLVQIEKINRDKAEVFDEEIVRLLIEFLEDANMVSNIIRSFIDNREPDSLECAGPQPAGILLAAKASHLQWLTVCLLEELRKSFLRS